MAVVTSGTLHGVSWWTINHGGRLLLVTVAPPKHGCQEQTTVQDITREGQERTLWHDTLSYPQPEMCLQHVERLLQIGVIAFDAYR